MCRQEKWSQDIPTCVRKSNTSNNKIGIFCYIKLRYISHYLLNYIFDDLILIEHCYYKILSENCCIECNYIIYTLTLYKIVIFSSGSKRSCYCKWWGISWRPSVRVPRYFVSGELRNWTNYWCFYRTTSRGKYIGFQIQLKFYLYQSRF